MRARKKIAVGAASSAGGPPLRALSKHDIDRCLERVTEAALAVDRGRGEEACEASLRPRRISPAELVRRMRPFLVYN